MSPSMMSPINQDWPACSMRLIHLSALLRKLHHKWRVSVISLVKKNYKGNEVFKLFTRQTPYQREIINAE